MADTPTPALAGAESAPVQTDAAKSPEDRLAQLFGSDEQPADTLEGDKAEDPAEAGTPEDEPEGDEPDEAPEGEEEPGEPGEDEDPADDAAEPEATADDDNETIHGNKFVVLRDNSKVRVGELKQSHERLRELETKVLPQVQQRLTAFQQEQAQFQAQQQQFQPVLAQVAQILQSQIPPAPDRGLLQSDPVEFFIQKDAHEAAVQQLQTVNQANAQAQQRAQQQYTEQLQQTAHQAVVRFVDAQPQLRDPEKGKAFISDYQAVAAHVGFTPQEAAQVYDPRLYRLAQLASVGLKAMQQGKETTAVKTQKQAIAAKKVASAPPVTPPAARQSASTRNESSLRQAKERLRKTGSVQDGIAALNSLGI